MKQSPVGGPGGGGGGGDTFGFGGGGGDTFGFGRSASFCWQRLHFFTGLPFLFRLLPCLFTHWHPLLVKPVRVTDLALQRAFFLPGPPTSAGAFLPCFRWTPLHMSVGPTVRPLPRSWQMPLLACPAWLRWQLSSNLHDFLGQPTQMVEVPLGEMGHAAGAAATQAMPATSAARRRSARPAGARRANGTSTICVGCPKKSCKFDDNCHLNQAGQARRGICQDLGSGLTVGPTDMCSGVQRKHGKNAPADVGGPGKKKARCNAKSVTRTGFTSSGCQCVNKQGNNLNKKGNPVKKCKRCQQKEALRPNPNVSPPPPPHPGPNFLEDNVMSMQYGAVEYTPSSPNGNWTSLCQIAAQARSVGYAADRPGSELGDSTIPNFAYLRDLWEGEVDVPDIGALYKNNQTTYPTDFMNNPASYMAGTKYFDAASQWYPSLQQDGGSGANTDFLSDYFFSAMQTKLGLTDEGEVDWSTALSGSKTISANQQILEKSSTYFVATTHAMYYLQLAEEAIAKNDTAGAKNHFDSIAAVYFGCGDTNPVPLPVYTPDSVVTTAPQVPTQIPWTKDSDKEDGDRGTVYSLYNLANKRASNYGRHGLFSLQSGEQA